MNKTIWIYFTIGIIVLKITGCARVLKSEHVDRHNQWKDEEAKNISATIPEDTKEVTVILNEDPDPSNIGDISKEEQQETDVGFTQSSETVGGKILPLNIRNSEPRFLSPELLVRSLAQHFNFGSSVIPKNCENTLDFLQHCTNSAEQNFCVQLHRVFTYFYCNIGGEAREKSSFLGATYTAGDLLSQWSLATALCNIQSQESEANLAATHLGIGYNQNKVNIAERLVRKFLPGIDDEIFILEVDFISQLLGYTPEADTFFDTIQGQRELAQGFAIACSYLIMHPNQLTY